MWFCELALCCVYLCSNCPHDMLFSRYSNLFLMNHCLLYLFVLNFACQKCTLPDLDNVCVCVYVRERERESGEGEGERESARTRMCVYVCVRAYVCVCVRAGVRACVRVCLCVCFLPSLNQFCRWSSDSTCVKCIV